MSNKTFVRTRTAVALASVLYLGCAYAADSNQYDNTVFMDKLSTFDSDHKLQKITVSPGKGNTDKIIIQDTISFDGKNYADLKGYLQVLNIQEPLISSDNKYQPWQKENIPELEISGLNLQIADAKVLQTNGGTATTSGVSISFNTRPVTNITSANLSNNTFTIEKGRLQNSVWLANLENIAGSVSVSGNRMILGTDSKDTSALKLENVYGVQTVNIATDFSTLPEVKSDDPIKINTVFKNNSLQLKNMTVTETAATSAALREASSNPNFGTSDSALYTVRYTQKAADNTPTVDNTATFCNNSLSIENTTFSGDNTYQLSPVYVYGGQPLQGSFEVTGNVLEFSSGKIDVPVINLNGPLVQNAQKAEYVHFSNNKVKIDFDKVELTNKVTEVNIKAALAAGELNKENGKYVPKYTFHNNTVEITGTPRTNNSDFKLTVSGFRTAGMTWNDQDLYKQELIQVPSGNTLSLINFTGTIDSISNFDDITVVYNNEQVIDDFLTQSNKQAHVQTMAVREDSSGTGSQTGKPVLLTIKNYYNPGAKMEFELDVPIETLEEMLAQGLPLMHIDNIATDQGSEDTGIQLSVKYGDDAIIIDGFDGHTLYPPQPAPDNNSGSTDNGNSGNTKPDKPIEIKPNVPVMHALSAAPVAAAMRLMQAADTIRYARMPEQGMWLAYGGGYMESDLDGTIEVRGQDIATGAVIALPAGDLALRAGLFFEAGDGHYKAKVKDKTSGDFKHYGGGLLLKAGEDTGFNALVTVRHGRVETEVKSNIKTEAKGDMTVPYTACEAGMAWGIEAFGLVAEPYARFMYTHIDSSSLKGMHFDDFNSHRSAVGANLYKQWDNLGVMLGAGWEHEFDAESKASFHGYQADSWKLQGDNALVEGKISYSPDSVDGLSLEAVAQGRMGDYQGFGGSFNAQYLF